MRLSRRDTFTISDDLVLEIAEENSSDGFSVGSLESIDVLGYSPFTSDDNASGRELEMVEYTDLCMDHTDSNLETILENSDVQTASEAMTISSQPHDQSPSTTMLVAQIALPFGTHMSCSLATQPHGHSSTAPGLVTHTGLHISHNSVSALQPYGHSSQISYTDWITY